MTETSSHRYKPRTAINAPNVKSSIFSRANNAATAKYPALVTTILSLIIGDFHVYIPTARRRLCRLFSPDAEIPALVPKLRAMSAFTTLIVRANPQPWQWKEISEFSASGRNAVETKLQRINCFTVLAMREAEHQKMQRACVNKVGIPPT